MCSYLVIHPVFLFSLPWLHPHFPSAKKAAVNLLEQHITAHTGWGDWTRAAYEEIKL